MVTPKSALSSVPAKKRSRYADSLESSPELLAQLQAAAEETLSLRDEVAAARAILGETMRTLGRITAQNDGIMPQSVAQLALGQMREVNALISSCAAIEAKRVDQQFDAAKMVLLLGRLKTDICLALKETSQLTPSVAVALVNNAFARARWTGALDQATVDEAMAAPASFDVKFRPIERDQTGKLLEHKDAFDSPEDALAAGKDLDLTPRSDKMRDARLSARDAANNLLIPTAVTPSTVKPLQRIEDEKLKAELEQANNQLDAEIADAQESGMSIPGVTEARTSKLSRAEQRALEDRA